MWDCDNNADRCFVRKKMYLIGIFTLMKNKIQHSLHVGEKCQFFFLYEKGRVTLNWDFFFFYKVGNA